MMEKSIDSKPRFSGMCIIGAKFYEKDFNFSTEFYTLYSPISTKTQWKAFKTAQNSAAFSTIFRAQGAGKTTLC